MNVTLHYGGRRFQNDKLFHSFYDAEGQIYLWSKISYAIIGRAYTATRSDDGGMRIGKVPEVDDAADEASIVNVRAWTVADACARDLAERRKLSSRMEKNPPALAAAVAALVPLLKSTPSGAARRQLVEILVQRATKKIYSEDEK